MTWQVGIRPPSPPNPYSGALPTYLFVIWRRYSNRPDCHILPLNHICPQRSPLALPMAGVNRYSNRSDRHNTLHGLFFFLVLFECTLILMK